MRLLFVLALLSALTPSLTAAQQVEQIQTSIYANTPCVVGTPAAVDGIATGNQEVFLENYVDTILPPIVYITWAAIWVEGINPIGPNTYGNLTFAVDPGRRYATAASYPANQTVLIQYLKTFGWHQLNPGGSQASEFKKETPIAYRTGDGIVIAPECIGGQTLPTYYFLSIQGMQDFYAQPQPASLLNIGLNQAVKNLPGWSARSKTAAASFMVTKFRARVYSAEPAISTTNPTPAIEVITHASVCVQDPVAAAAVPPRPSSCIDNPVQLKFNTRDSLSLSPTQWAWSDWTPISIAAGQVPLVTCSWFQSGNVNAWSLQTTGGLGAWATPNDAWNMKDLPAGFLDQPTRTQCIDRVQVQ